MRKASVLLLWITSLGSVGFAQGPSATPLEIFAGLSGNADYVPSRPYLIISDQKVSPFFGHGSGIGFDVSFKRYVWNGLGIKADLAGYSDTFPKGAATYCQPSDSANGVTCATGLTHQATVRAFYFTAGPEWKFRRDKRVAPFAQVLVGIVHARSTFEMSGSDVQYTNPFTGGLLLFTTAGFPQDRNIRYSDSHADTGFAMTLGGGVDIRLTKRLSLRVGMDYDPTFLVRPVIRDLTLDAQGRVTLPQLMANERQRQDHLRLNIGLVWHFGR
jgi:opacity protein-like surface antigen